MDVTSFVRIAFSIALALAIALTLDAVRRGDHNEGRQWMTLALLTLLLMRG